MSFHGNLCAGLCCVIVHSLWKVGSGAYWTKSHMLGGARDNGVAAALSTGAWRSSGLGCDYGEQSPPNATGVVCARRVESALCTRGVYRESLLTLPVSVISGNEWRDT